MLPIPDNAPSMPTTCGKLGKPSRTWSYRDAEGRLLFYVCRFEQPEGRKEFVRYRCGWMPVRCAGNGKASRNRVRSTGWIYSRLNLMRLSLSTRVKRPLMLAADLLPGFVSVTSPNGAQSPDKADWQARRAARYSSGRMPTNRAKSMPARLRGWHTLPVRGAYRQ